MSRSHARSRARPRRAPATASRWTLAGTLALVGLGCADASLDAHEPHADVPETTTGGTLPVLDTGAATTGEASTGEPVVPEDPRLCATECSLVLPVSWTYQGTPPSRPEATETHAVPAMLRDADGMLTVAELREGKARLYRLDRDGHLQWNVPLPLPCDRCELTDVAPHPSGDLLLSATGWKNDVLSLLTARYDAVEHALVWITSRPLAPVEGVQTRSGDIAALSDDLVAQLSMTGLIAFNAQQSTAIAAYGTDGLLLDEERLVLGQATTLRPPLIARPTADGELVIAVFQGSDSNPFGLTDRVAPPLWHNTGFAFPTEVLDDLRVSGDGHALELSHAFDGTHAHLLLADRVDVEPSPRWVASVAMASTTTSTAALALGPDGDVYAALRTTQSPGGTGDPLIGLSLVRWTPLGELRWSTTLLLAMAESFSPIELAIDDDDGLVVASVVEDRLRVERRAQHCACGT